MNIHDMHNHLECELVFNNGCPQSA